MQEKIVNLRYSLSEAKKALDHATRSLKKAVELIEIFKAMRGSKNANTRIRKFLVGVFSNRASEPAKSH